MKRTSSPDGGEHSRRLREPRRADRSGARSDPFRTSGHDVREQPGDATRTLSLFRRRRRAATVRHECADRQSEIAPLE